MVPFFTARNNISHSSNATAGSSSSRPSAPTNTNHGGANRSNRLTNRDPNADAPGLNEDAPPAYTPSADVRHGETTIEVGPRRPFHSAPQQPQQQSQLLSPESTSSSRPHTRSQSQSGVITREQTLNPHLPTGNVNVPQPPRRPSSAGPSSPRSVGADLLALTGQFLSSVQSRSNTRLPLPPPPPRHPLSSSAPQSSATSAGPSSPSRSNLSRTHIQHPSSSSLPESSTTVAVGNGTSRSDFARDFYNAGPLPSDSLNDDSTLALSSSFYSPPPGPPPGRPRAESESLGLNTTQTSDFALDFYATGYGDPAVPASLRDPSGSLPSNTRKRNDIPNDGKPTSTLVPGHPLLKDGQTLIYPTGYTCEKCGNTGYKKNDPTHPCRKCWTKYGKPYTGALLYTTWTDDGSSNFQRPLRNLRPTASSPNVSTLASTSSPPGARSRSQARTTLQRRQAPSQPPPPRQIPRIEFADPYLNPPPPGALVVPPGDARLGGELCWKCKGQGVLSTPFLLLFDDPPCNLCGGTGRIY